MFSKHIIIIQIFKELKNSGLKNTFKKDDQEGEFSSDSDIKFLNCCINPFESVITRDKPNKPYSKHSKQNLR